MSVDVHEPREALFAFLFNSSLASYRLVPPPKAAAMDPRRRARPRLIQPSLESSSTVALLLAFGIWHLACGLYVCRGCVLTLAMQ
jgi:hypothetical protein